MILPDLPSGCKMVVLHMWGISQVLIEHWTPMSEKKVYYARPVSESYSLEKCPY